jgi:hypothetical protein
VNSLVFSSGPLAHLRLAPETEIFIAKSYQISLSLHPDPALSSHVRTQLPLKVYSSDHGSQNMLVVSTYTCGGGRNSWHPVSSRHGV